MTRTIGTHALVLILLFTLPTLADSHVPDPHIRTTCAALREALARGSRVSPTLRAIIDRLEASDVVVYLVSQRSEMAGIAAHVSSVSAAGGRRYLRIVFDPKYGGCQLMGLLGHELRHALEIAEEPSVVDARSLAILYRRIGFSRDGMDQFDSTDAIEAGRRVMRDALSPVAERALVLHPPAR